MYSVQRNVASNGRGSRLEEKRNVTSNACITLERTLAPPIFDFVRNHSNYTRLGKLAPSMASSSLSIPIAFWPNNVSAATISTTLTCDRYVAAGLEDGLIWILRGAVEQAGSVEDQDPTFKVPTPF